MRGTIRIDCRVDMGKKQERHEKAERKKEIQKRKLFLFKT